MESDDMDTNYIEAHHIVDRYVQGTLDEAERDAFEVFMLENPSIANEVELAKGYQSGLKSQDADLAPAPRYEDGGAQVAAFWRPLAIAASAVVLVSTASTGFLLLGQTQTVGPLDAAPAESVVRLELLRSSNLRVFQNNRSAPMVLEIDTGRDADSSYELELVNKDRTYLTRLSSLRSTEGILTTRMTNLPDDSYTVSLRQSGSDEAVFVASFELISPQQ